MEWPLQQDVAGKSPAGVDAMPEGDARGGLGKHAGAAVAC